MPGLIGAAHCLEASREEVRELGFDILEQEQEEETDTFTDGVTLERLEERYASRFNENDDEPLREPLTSNKHAKLKHGIVQKASEGIIEALNSAGICSICLSHWTHFVTFLEGEELIGDEGIQGLVSKLPKDFPEWICAWIMSRADTIDIHTGEEKHPLITRVSYGQAQKMRAAITHKFGREFGLGSAPWTEDPLNPGQFCGNPSISAVVSQYMISLRRRKVKSGEVVTSACAMNEDIMKRLYDFNKQVPLESLAPNGYKCKAPDDNHWAGHRVRTMLHCLYTISMLCLLRYDEALNIRWEDITLHHTPDGIHYLRLNLPFRKTHQYGDILPFYLYLTPNKLHMCAVTAMAHWWQLCEAMGIQTFGYVFRKRAGYDRISYNAEDKMSSESFLVCLRNNLCDIDVDPHMYGTHSFRRGGCQYLHLVLRWPIRDICTWGGWAEDFDSPGTIFKYLLSWTDMPLVERADYFNPNRKGTNPCSTCNRTCHCA